MDPHPSRFGSLQKLRGEPDHDPGVRLAGLLGRSQAAKDAEIMVLRSKYLLASQDCMKNVLLM
jgi:hypothetical protein